MVRQLVLAVLLCICAWATAARSVPEPSPAVASAAGADLCVQPDGSTSAGDSEGRWNAAARAEASITESVWKFSLVHADLAGARCSDPSAPILTFVLPDLRTRPAPGRLLSLPLLI